MTRTALPTLAFLPLLALAGCSGPGGDPGGSDPALAPPDTQEDANGWLFGVLSGPDGPLAGGTVAVEGQPQVRTGPDGSFLVANLPPGRANATFTAEFHAPHAAFWDIRAGEGTRASPELALAYLAPGVPERDGLLVTYVDEDDRLLVAAGAAGGMTVGTEKTNDRAYYGYWKVNPDEGYAAAHWFVNVSWTPSPTVAQLGVRYFRGESLQENEIVEGTSPGYHFATETGAGDAWRSFEIATEDLAAFGKRTWQIGVYPSSGGQEQPYGADTSYHITITAALLSDAAAAAAPPA